MSQRIVIIGGGFAGLSTAISLSRHINSSDDVEVTLVDKQSEHIYRPLIYEVASGGLVDQEKIDSLKSGVAIPFNLDGHLSGYRNISFRQGDVMDIDLKKNNVLLSTGALIEYDHLVMAMGACSGTFGIEGVEKYSIAMVSLKNAISIREKCTNLIVECDKKLRPEVNMVIVGGGSNGVEICAELASALRQIKKRHPVKCKWNITIIDAGPAILSNIGRFVSMIATRRLRKLGVNIACGTFVKAIKPTAVMVEPNIKRKNISPYVKTTKVKSDITIWAAGFSARTHWKEWGMPVDKRGYVQTLPTLQMKGTNNVFIAGDAASIQGRRMQQRAPEAIEQGRVVAENLIRIIRGQPILKSHSERQWPFAIPLGNRYAVGSFGPITIFGFPAYILRKLIDLNYFLGVMNIVNAIKIWWHGGKVYLEND